jgi:hypothetical protein
MSPTIRGTQEVPKKTLPAGDTQAASEPARAWQLWGPDEFVYGKPEAIDEKDSFEVVGTMRDIVVEHDLHDRSFKKIDPLTAKSLTGHYYRYPEGKHPYLVRAIYGHASTGAYDFKKLGRKLRIHHSSLGINNGLSKAAFVLNLDFEPEILYVSAGFAM